jgi:uncharacterized protein with GYD domain
MQVRTAYIVKGWSADKCSEEFNIDPTTIRKRASKEGWTGERHSLAIDATLVATEDLKSGATQVINSVREDHANLVKRMHTILDGIDEDIAAIKPGRSRIEARKAGAEAFGTVLKSSRLVLGIRDGDASVAPEQAQDDEAGKEYVVAITPAESQEGVA